MPFTTVGFENFPSPKPNVPQHSEHNGQHLCLCCFEGIIPSQHWKDGLLLWVGFSLSLFSWCHSAALRAAKATGMSGWLLANVKLTLEQRSFKSRRQIYLSYRLNRIKQISTSCRRRVAQPPKASSIIKKAHVFKIKLFLTVSLKYLLFWHTFWFLRFCQAVMTLTSFFETFSFPLSSSIHLINWISSNEKRNRIYSKYTWGSSWGHFFFPSS